MGKHQLQLNFPDTTNEGILLIDDISIYDPTLLSATATDTVTVTSNTVITSQTPPGSDIPIETATTTTTTDERTPCNGYILPCSTLEITPPGFIEPVVLSTTYTNFRLVLNACMIGIALPLNCGDSCPALPDGIYNIRYSVAPNDKVFVEYKILRTVQAINRYYDLLCQIGLTNNLPEQETEYQLEALETIYNYLLAAKVMVENRHQFTEGINVYRFACTLMDKMSYEPSRC